MAHVDALSRAHVCLYLNSIDKIATQISDHDRSLNYESPLNVITNSKTNNGQTGITETPFKILKDQDLKEQLTVKRNGRIVTVLSPTMVLKVLTEAHDRSGHPGIRKTQLQIQSQYYWLQMRYDIKQFVQSCHIYQINKTANHPTFGEL